MKESEYVTSIIYHIEHVILDSVKAVKYVPVGTGKGEPDIISIIKGYGVVIEAKIAPNKPAKIQEVRLDEWYAVDCLALVATYPQQSPFKVACAINYMLDNKEHPALQSPMPRSWYQKRFDELVLFL